MFLEPLTFKQTHTLQRYKKKKEKKEMHFI